MKQQIEYIEAVVCAEELIEPIELHTRNRERNINDARQVIMYFANKFGCTQYEAGGYFKRDHATVVHANKTVNDRRDTEKGFRDKIDRYDAIIKEGIIHKSFYLTNKLKDIRKEAEEIIIELDKILNQ